MVVQHNLTAMNANRYLGINNNALSKSLEKLSSGYAINRAGDNAAGLAVSEKMRSQIAGLTQGVKNATDGISMIQTFEGALTETDSILQRMKTLADQAANGTYQDDVDRDAIQLEFDQLNDELNQIADTDFNGVICLNGGEMADGVKAVNGKFDYANNARTAKQLSSADINKLDSQGVDDAGTTSAKMIDDLWIDLGFDRTDTNLNNDGPDSIDITFQYDSSTSSWSAISASNGAAIDEIVVNTAPNNGGFQVGSTNSVATPDTKSNLVNVVLDGSTLVNGDTITITFNNPSVKNTAIENIGVSDADYSNLSVKGTGINDTSNLTVEVTNVDIESTNNGQTTAMTEDLDRFFKMLDGADVTVTYGAAANATGISISMTDKSTGNVTTVSAAGKFTVGNTDFYATVTNGALEIGLGTTGIDTSLVKLTSATNGAAAADQSTGTVKYTLAVDQSKYTSATKPTAEIADPSSVVSKANAYTQATAPLTYTDHIVLQTGARSKDAVDFTFKYTSGGMGDLKANMNCSAREDGLNTANLSLRTQESANAAIDQIDNAINKVSMVRATFGAVQNRLEHKIDNMNVTLENITSAESGIRDTNMPEEMMNFTKAQILAQASQSMLAQANTLPQSVLSLLQ